MSFVFSLQQEQKDPHHHPQVPPWWELWGLGLRRAHHNWLNNFSGLHWHHSIWWFTPTILSGQSATQTQKIPKTDAIFIPQFDPQKSTTSGDSVRRRNKNTWNLLNRHKIKTVCCSQVSIFIFPVIWLVAFAVSLCRCVPHNSSQIQS